jgi:hypothetical protein
MANAKTPGGEHLNFDELFAGEQPPPAAKGEAGKENLQELEAFLDDFEKNLGDAKEAPKPAAPAPAAAFAEPHEAEELVHGLLKEDELNLDVEGAAAKAAADQVEEFEPHPLPSAPLDIPAFIHAAPAANGKPVPAAAAGFSRIGFILSLVLGGVALLVALGAGWMALNATQAVQGMEMREGGAPGADPRITRLQSDVSALRKQVEDLSKTVEGSLSDLSGRVAVLEKVNGIAPAPTGAAAAEPAAPANGKAEPPKAVGAKPATPEAPTAVTKPAAPVPAPEPSKVPPPKAAAAVPGGVQPAAKGAASTPVQPTAPKAAAPAPPPATAKAPVAPQNGAAAPAPAAPATASPAPAAPSAAVPAGAAAPAPAKPAKPALKAKPAPAGDWVVHLTSADEKKRAQAQLDHARAKGLAARLTTGVVEGKTWYRVTVEGFATPEAARAFVGKEALAAGFNAAWIGQR